MSSQGEILSAETYRGGPLLACLLGPPTFALLRKVVPGQPNAIVPAFGFALVTSLYLLQRSSRTRHLPQKLIALVGPWAAVQAFYALLGAGVHLGLPFLSFALRIAPLACIPIAFRSLHSRQDLLVTVRIIRFVPIAIMPVGLVVLFFGNGALPIILRPSIAIAEIGKDYRVGFSMCSAIFATAPVLSTSMLACLILVLATLRVETSPAQRHFHMLSVVSVFVLIYASTRRGALYLAGVCLLIFIAAEVRKASKYMVLVVACLCFLYLLDRSSAEPIHGSFETRSDFLAHGGRELRSRLQEVLLSLSTRAYALFPFGSYLGFAGNEAEILTGANVPISVETGATKAIVETGIIGLLFFPLTVFLIVSHYWRARPATDCGKVSNMLLVGFVLLFILHYTKEITALTSYYMSHILFWSIPGMVAALHRLDRASGRRRNPFVRREVVQPESGELPAPSWQPLR